MSNNQQMMCAKCHGSVRDAIDNLIPSKYMSRSEFILTAIREKLEKDGIEYH